VIDSAHTMIGNILRGTDVQIETLAEIEDTLGIRIMHHHQAPAGADPEQRPDFSFGIPPSSGSTSGPTVRRTRGSGGYVPHVNQSVIEGISGSSSRSNDFSYMEYSFGYGVFTDAQLTNEDEEDDLLFLNIPSNMDAQLFPNGAAATTHFRTIQLVHSLLYGVELPPVCSLRSGFRPSSSSSTNRGTNYRTITFGALSGGGNIIRLRGPNGTQIVEHHWP